MSEVATRTETLPAAANPMEAIMKLATSGAAVDMEVMRGMMDMRKEFEAEQARIAYNEAMARAQANMPIIFRDRERDRGMKYATYEQITKQIRPVYTREGLSLAFDSEPAADGLTKYICVVKHSSGHSEQYAMTLPSDGGGSKNAVQALGSSMTYAKRYLTMDVFALAQSDDPDDDDGNAAAREEEGLRIYNEFCRENWDLIHDIKVAVANDDKDGLVGLIVDAAEADNAAGRVNQDRTLSRIVRIAPTKGGWLTVEEKKAIVNDEMAKAVREVMGQ